MVSFCPSRSRSRRGGFALAELMVSIAIFSAVSVGLILAFVALKRNYAATTDFALNHADQMRISDYLALDFRRAISVDPPVTTANVSNDISIYVPFYCDTTPARNLQQPVLDTDGAVYYGSVGASVRIHYYLSGSTIYRQEGDDTPTAVANNVQDFTFTAKDPYRGVDASNIGKVIATTITFRPTFRSAAGSENTRTATAFYNTTLLRNNGKVY